MSGLMVLSYSLFAVIFICDLCNRTFNMPFSFKVHGVNHGDVVRVEFPEAGGGMAGDSDIDNEEGPHVRNNPLKRNAVTGANEGSDDILNEVQTIKQLLLSALSNRDGPLMARNEVTAVNISGIDPNAWTLEDQEVARSLFSRYDLDGSGTVNTFEEAQQITTNLMMKFTTTSSTSYKPNVLAVSSEKLREAIQPLQHTIENDPMDFGAYWKWYTAHFGP